MHKTVGVNVKIDSAGEATLNPLDPGGAKNSPLVVRLTKSLDITVVSI